MSGKSRSGMFKVHLTFLVEKLAIKICHQIKNHREKLKEEMRVSKFLHKDYLPPRNM
jgi:hypothetical protein